MSARFIFLIFAEETKTCCLIHINPLSTSYTTTQQSDLATSLLNKVITNTNRKTV